MPAFFRHAGVIVMMRIELGRMSVEFRMTSDEQSANFEIKMREEKNSA